jgi:mannosyltransferase OCH1-like enzyme
MTIPKIIMQTWKTKNVPRKWIPSVTSIKKYMKGWKHVLLTDKDNRKFIKNHFPDFLPYYDKFEYNIQRADAIRACWLYVNGGIYMDLDFKLKKNMAELFNSDDEVYLVHSGNIGSVLTNSFMASRPKCSLWKVYIEEMKKPPVWWAYGKHIKVMTTTGPLCLTRAVRKWKGTYNNLPSKYIMPCSVCDLKNCDTRDAYLIPLKGGSWNDIDSLIFNQIMCNWKRYLFIIFILFILILIFR